MEIAARERVAPVDSSGSEQPDRTGPGRAQCSDRQDGHSHVFNGNVPNRFIRLRRTLDAAAVSIGG